jgi:histidyl-tRNA synthetase
LCRAERPQKGRLREFFQWNIDIIGVDDVLADAEVIFCALDYLRDVGLTPNDVVVKISSRKMLAVLLRIIGIEEAQLGNLYAVLDKRSKLPNDTFEKMLSENVNDESKCQKIRKLLSIKSIEQISTCVELTEEAKESVDELNRLFRLLGVMGVNDYCVFDISIVRGLAYYTGVVYEIYDKANELRAIGGGGRYDNLLRDFGGPDIPATGLAIGDCVLGILLEEKGLIKPELRELDYFVACVDEAYKEEVIKLTMKLRSEGWKAGFSYKSAKLGKQLKEASEQKAKKCIIIGDEFEENKLAIKNMVTGQQELIELDRFFTDKH